MAHSTDGTRGTRVSLGARRALHTWQPLVPLLSSLPRGTDEANQSDVALLPLGAGVSLQPREARRPQGAWGAHLSGGSQEARFTHGAWDPWKTFRPDTPGRPSSPGGACPPGRPIRTRLPLSSFLPFSAFSTRAARRTPLARRPTGTGLPRSTRRAWSPDISRVSLLPWGTVCTRNSRVSWGS